MPAAKRFLLVAIGEAGHAFPMIAIGRQLRARGHEVAIHTWVRWQQHVETEDMAFFKAPVFVHAPYAPAPNVHQAAALATDELLEVVRGYRPDVIVSDILTLAGSLAAEKSGTPHATFVPHFWHVTGQDEAPFGSGWAPARSWPAKQFFRLASKFERHALEYGRNELNETRARVSLAPIERVHGAMSEQLVLVGTLPQLEPLRSWPAHVRVVGPVMWEPPSDCVEIPVGDDPLVVIAPSTAQDLDHRMLGASVSGLRGLPVRVLAAKNGREPGRALKPGSNTSVVNWVSYSQVLPEADVIVCHGGHGTIMRALTSGAAVVVCPASGDQFENAARLRWAGVGVAVPASFVSSRTIAAAVEKVLARPRMTQRVARLSAWAAENNGAAKAARELERFAARE